MGPPELEARVTAFLAAGQVETLVLSSLVAAETRYGLLRLPGRPGRCGSRSCSGASWPMASPIMYCASLQVVRPTPSRPGQRTRLPGGGRASHTQHGGFQQLRIVAGETLCRRMTGPATTAEQRVLSPEAVAQATGYASALRSSGIGGPARPRGRPVTGFPPRHRRRLESGIDAGD